MKKLYTFFGIVIASLANAQSPTLSTVVVPSVGFSYNMNEDTAAADLSAITVSAGSASAQNWDYSTKFNTTYSTTTSFVAPSSGQGSSNFPSANLALNQGGNWIYMIGGSNGLLIDGIYASIQGNNIALNFNPNPAQIPVPFTYANTYSVAYTATATATFSSIPAEIHHSATRTINADAFGQLKTPAATYTNTLRLKMHEETIDSVFAVIFGSLNFVQAQYDTTTNYSWYQNAQSALLMSIDQRTNGSTQSASYLQAFSNGIKTVGNATAALNLYPNPASSLAYITYENTSASAVSASLYDVNGKEIASFMNNELQSMGAQTLAIDLNALKLPKGLYLVRLSVNGENKTLKMNVE